MSGCVGIMGGVISPVVVGAIGGITGTGGSGAAKGGSS